MRSGAGFFVEEGARAGQARRRGRVRRGEAEVLPGERGGHPAPRGARDQSLSYQERLSGSQAPPSVVFAGQSRH